MESGTSEPIRRVMTSGASFGQGTYYAPDFRTPEGLVAGTPGEYVTEAVVSKSIEWLEQDRDKEKPFMLMVQHKAPHRFWLPPVHLLDEYVPRTIRNRKICSTITRAGEPWPRPRI